MNAMKDDYPTLEQDATLDEPLRRVAYEAGMMLGLEATRDEQAYHRRRLNRHQYWLNGFGTLAGMAVSMDPASHPNATDPVTVRLIVGPGLGIDGLGREVLMHEPYCIHMGEWLQAQSETRLREGFNGLNRLWLKITVRHMDCSVGLQPVLARKLNLSTDAVQPSRTADSVRLELIPELPPEDDPTGGTIGADPPVLASAAQASAFQPWGCHPPLSGAAPELTLSEQATVNATAGAAQAQLSLQARLLHGLDNGVGTRNLAEAFEEGARLLLARICITTTDVNAIVVNPQRISINNLVRPFMVNAGQLAWLARQP